MLQILTYVRVCFVWTPVRHNIIPGIVVIGRTQVCKGEGESRGNLAKKRDRLKLWNPGQKYQGNPYLMNSGMYQVDIVHDGKGEEKAMESSLMLHLKHYIRG